MENNKVQVFGFEVGVLLSKEHEEFDCYVCNNRDLPYGFYDENQDAFSEEFFEEYKDAMRKYVENGVDMTYGVISKQDIISKNDDIYQDFVNGDELVPYEYDYSFFKDSSLIEWSICKINGEIKENFLQYLIEASKELKRENMEDIIKDKDVERVCTLTYNVLTLYIEATVDMVADTEQWIEYIINELDSSRAELKTMGISFMEFGNIPVDNTDVSEKISFGRAATVLYNTLVLYANETYDTYMDGEGWLNDLYCEIGSTEQELKSLGIALFPNGEIMCDLRETNSLDSVLSLGKEKANEIYTGDEKTSIDLSCEEMSK